MRRWQRHLPDGMSDLLPEACRLKRALEGRLRASFEQRGYAEIETPGIEFYDAYAAGTGTVPQEELFKFVDRQGRILCLRYDGTVPTARVAATLFEESPLPQRFYYIGQMYRYNEYGGGRQRAFSQAGIELLGSDRPEADAEVIATAIRSAQAIGLTDIQVSIGQVACFTGLLEQWGIGGDQAEQLRRLIDSKQMDALEELTDTLQLSAEARAAISGFATGMAGDEELARLGSLIENPIAQQALDQLLAVLDLLEDDGCRDKVTVDLGLLQSMQYYTGIVFKGFTTGLGFPLFSGGRYDQLSQHFDRNVPATGFSLGISLAMAALQRQGFVQEIPDRPVWLLYEQTQRQQAFNLAEQLRQTGCPVICETDPADRAAFLAADPQRPVLLINKTGSRTWLQGRDVRCEP